MTLSGMTTNDPRTYSTVRVKHVIGSVVCEDMRPTNWRFFCDVLFDFIQIS